MIALDGIICLVCCHLKRKFCRVNCMMYKHPLQSAGMAGSEFGSDRLGDNISGQNPWWAEGGGIPPSRAPAYARDDLCAMIDGLDDREVHAVAGARQAGKTTMLMQLAARLVAERGVDPKRIMYISLDEPPFLSGARHLLDALEWYAREVVREPPGGITERIYVMLDEIQEVDGWQNILKRWVDLHRNAKFLVSGSSSIGMLSGASESLVGRIRYQQVMPMSFAEYASLKGIGGAARAGAEMRRALAAALGGKGAEEFHGAARSAHAGLAAQADEMRSLLSEYLEYGGRPGVALEGDPARKRSMLADQLQLAIYKDIVRAGGVRDPASIDTLLSMLAWKSPQIVNTNRLGRDLGVNRGTAKHYMHLIKAAYIVHDAQVYSDNPGVRARSERKVYVGDPGTRTAALRAPAGGMRGDPADAGRVAEAAVCDHTMRLGASYEAAWGGDLFYWRNSRGDEVDAVVRIGGRALPVESKYRARVKESDLRGIRRFADQFGTGMGIVVSGGDMGEAGGGIVLIPLWLYLLMG